MIHPKSIIYDGRKFTIGSKGTYYFARVKGKSESLHRYKYMKEKGAIPGGWHVHHEDRDCYNNDISNLIAISPEDHYKLHPTAPEILVTWQSAGIKAAPEWHSSVAGSDWHKANYEKNKATLQEKVQRECCNCGIAVMTKRKLTNAFCSNNCKSAWRRKNNPDMIDKECEKCKTVFSTRKYNQARFCSRACKPAPNPLGYKARKLPSPFI